VKRQVATTGVVVLPFPAAHWMRYVTFPGIAEERTVDCDTRRQCQRLLFRQSAEPVARLLPCASTAESHGGPTGCVCASAYRNVGKRPFKQSPGGAQFTEVGMTRITAPSLLQLSWTSEEGFLSSRSCEHKWGDTLCHADEANFSIRT
jgi:hypothetical protein